jgi:DNA-directed RNA polymerase II subunit RPB2
VHTAQERLLGNDEMPNGVNAIVAIMCMEGYDQEDSVILNRGSLERGLFRSTKTTVVRDEEKSMGANIERFERPDPKRGLIGMRDADYSHLDDDGMPHVGASLEATGDDMHEDVAVIGKTMASTPIVPVNGGNGASANGGGGDAMHANLQVPVVSRDRSAVHKRGDNMRVDAVMMTSNKPATRQSANLVKVRLREDRMPEIGDKFASRQGQKGICGMIYAQEDMPFDPETGITPDLLVNPHCEPSRMTVGHMIEALLGLFGAVSGKYEACDATAFQGTDINKIGEELKKLGLPPFAKRPMINGMTGQMYVTMAHCVASATATSAILTLDFRYDALIFQGVIYYQRLRHMVADKIHGRSRGPVQILTRQPVEGRSRDGGLRFGEMERDTIISHGASSVMQSMLLHNSDAYRAPICGGCGLTAIPPAPRELMQPRHRGNSGGGGLSAEAEATKANGGPYCQNCRRGDLVRYVTMPYAFNLLSKELAAMNIAMRVKLEPDGTAT